MAGIYDEIEIEDMTFDEAEEMYYYPCPCGDKFSISLEELYDGEDIASCPSCTLRIRVIFDVEKLPTSKNENIDVISADETTTKNIESIQSIINNINNDSTLPIPIPPTFKESRNIIIPNIESLSLTSDNILIPPVPTDILIENDNVVIQ